VPFAASIRDGILAKQKGDEIAPAALSVSPLAAQS
jgi:hypothetical protein